MKRRQLVLSAPALAVSVLQANALAQATGQPFPTKVITIFVPYPAGGISDQQARTIAPHLSKALGQPVVVENLTGAGGSIAAQKMLSSPADGHSLMVVSPNETILAPRRCCGSPCAHLTQAARQWRSCGCSSWRAAWMKQLCCSP